MSKKPGKPLILTDYARDHEDEVEALIAKNRAMEDGFDPMFIDGYTQVMKANDIAKADDLDWGIKHEKTGLTKKKVYNTIGAQPRELPVHFLPVRVAGIDGTHNANVSRDMAEYTRWGYRPAKYPDDFTKHGFGQPLGYTVQADGTLRREDLQLYVVDGRAEKARLRLLAEQAAEAENVSTKIERESGVEFEGTAERRRETVNYDTEVTTT